MKLGIIKETKQPADKRTPLTPLQCKVLKNKFNKLEIVVQSSDIRCFNDDAYQKAGIPVKNDLSDCDVLLGVKEVNVDTLIPEKTYLFFSHTTKKQAYNKKLLQTILKKHIRVIDYEMLTDSKGLRLIGFGRYAGLVGAYNGLRAFSVRQGNLALKPAYLCSDLKEMYHELKKLDLSAIKIVVTGSGRVTGGAMELLNEAGITKIPVTDFLSKPARIPVYAQLEPIDYVKHPKQPTFELQHFIENPHLYKNNFERFLPHADMLISAAYWDPRAPVLFTTNQVNNSNFAIKVIADITCDINGSVPTTKKTTTIEAPFYDYIKTTGEITSPFTDSNNITVMAVDNLPGELPVNASEYFGEMLSSKVIPLIYKNDQDAIIIKATITENGHLTEEYKYLEEWINS